MDRQLAPTIEPTPPADRQVPPPQSAAPPRIAIRARSRRIRLLVDFLIAFVFSLAVLAVFRVNQWVVPYTPDSDFYFGLGNFGSQVIDRATDPSYFWSRIGLVGPVSLIISVLGSDLGYLVWRVLLLGLTVISIFLIAWRKVGRIAAATAVLIVATNTTVLVTLADFYPSSAVIAGFSLFTGFGCLAATGTGARARQLAAAGIAGGAVGWLLAIHLGTVAVACAASLTLMVYLIVRLGKRSWRPILCFLVGAAGVFLIFQVWLQALFPGRNWFSANYAATTEIDWSFFHEKTLNWLWTDPNLLVPPIALAIGLIVGSRASRLQREIRAATWFLVAASLAAVIQQFILGGQNLQLPYYYSQIWPFAILVLVLAVVTLELRSGQRVALLVVAAVLLPVAGMATFVFTWFPIGLALAIVVLAGYAAAFWISGSEAAGAGLRALSLVACAVCLCGIQVLQNGLGPVPGLVIPRQSPQQAFAAPQPWVQSDFALAHQVEGWVLANTPDNQKVATWTGATVQALQGSTFVAVDNSAMAGFLLEPNQLQLKILRKRQPETLAFTAATTQDARLFISRIPQEVAAATVHECKDFREGELSVGSCLAHLSYQKK